MKPNPFAIIADLTLCGANAATIETDQTVVCVSFDSLSTAKCENALSLNDPKLLEQLKQVNAYEYKHEKGRLLEVAALYCDRSHNWNLRNIWWNALEEIEQI